MFCPVKMNDALMSTTSLSFPATVSSGARWSLLVEGLRYLAASVAALAIDATILWICVSWLAWPLWVSGAIAYSSGLILIYLLSVRWVFAARSMRNASTELLSFALLGLLGLFLNSATLTIATSLGVTLLLAKALSAGIGFIANFVSRKLILFSGAR